MLKFILVLIIVSSLQAFSKGYGQSKINVSFQNVPLKKAFKEIEKKSDYRFLYNDDVLDKNSLPASLNVVNASLDEAMAALLANTNLVYRLNENNLVILSEKGGIVAANKITGKVTDEAGQPMPGVSIKLKGSELGTQTGLDGKYALDIPDAKANNAVLVFSFVGYNTQEVSISGNSIVNIQLKAAPNSLNELIVVGYGSVKKKDLTGSVSVVNVDNAKKTASYDVAKLLQGQAAGVSVQGSGEPGGFVQIKVRGIATFGNNSPLFVIDGVPVDAPFDFPTDNIESIQVLKDASAGAIYGARAATGVVIITTKKGRSGPLKVNLDSYYGLQNIAKKIPVTDRLGYQKIATAAELNANLSIAPGNDPSNAAYISNVNTDWQKEMFKTGRIQDHNVSLSGGSDAVSYNLGLGDFDQTSTLSGPQSYKRYTYNGSFQGKKGIFSFGGKTAYTQSHKDNLAFTDSHAVFGGGVTSMLTAIPTMPVYDANRLGGYGGSDNVTQRAITLNVIGMNNLVKDYSDRNRMFGNVWGALELAKNLTYKINLSYDRTDYNNFHYEPSFDLGFYYLNTKYDLRDQKGDAHTGLMENTLAYQLNLGKNKIDFLAGTSYEADHNEFITGTATDAGSLQFFNFGAIPNASAKGLDGYSAASTLFSYFGRINYNYDGRYLFTANFRRDGSSRFSPSKRFGDFPSVAAAWNVSNEKFLHLPSFISSLKLRSGYGVLGNQNFANYMFQSYINGNASYVFGNTLAPGATAVTVVDPTIKWESTTTANAAIDLGLFNDKLLFTAEYFYKKSTDLIANIPIGLSNGSIPSSVITNAASVQNKGIEFTLTYKDDIGKFHYDITANANTLKNKVLKLGNTNNPIPGAGSKTIIGGEIGELYGFKTEGIFQSAADIASHATQTLAAPGDIKFKDVNKDGVITDDDRVFLGSVIPKIYYGLNFSVSYSSFDASFFFQGSAGNKVFNGVYQNLMGGQYSNASVDELKFWTPTNTNTNVPRPIIGDPNGNGRFSDRFVESGSYVKLQNAQVGYTIPKSILNRTHVFNSFRVYLSGQNLLTVSKYRGYDPDFISDGLFSRGFDYGSFPNPRTVMLGVQIGL
jgi:TonB-linked SusC/RagA family outer membrane protein